MIHKLSRYLLTLTALFALSTGAWATELTVCDGTYENSYFPVAREYIMCYQKNEMVFPAEDLAAMTGQYITSMQFYAVQESVSLAGANYKVFLMETNSDEVRCEDSKYKYYGDMAGADITTVYEGELSVADSKLIVTFTTPYTYNGGNLVVGFYNTNPVLLTAELLKFYSANTTKFTGVHGEAGSSQSLDAVTQGTDAYKYLPKTTFTYSSVEMNEARTEATFTMPAYDATVEYELVRDMAVAINAEMPASIRIEEKQGGGYQLVNPDDLRLTVKDEIVANNPKTMTVDVDYTLQLQKLNGQNWEDADANSLTEGTYRYKITAVDGSLYDGTTNSTAFQLFLGYPVEVPAREYVTYYSKEENLYVENTNAKLFTITTVSGSTATATEIESANKEMPFLVYNNTNQKQTFVLLPTPTEINQTFAPEFVGSQMAATIYASTSELTNYAFNGKQFVIVRSNLAVAANKAWLAIPTSTARTISIVLDDATSIDNGQLTIDNSDDNVYDLQGRKMVHGTSSNGTSIGTLRKGVYVKNGQKVIIK